MKKWLLCRCLRCSASQMFLVEPFETAELAASIPTLPTNWKVKCPLGHVAARVTRLITMETALLEHPAGLGFGRWTYLPMEAA